VSLVLATHSARFVQYVHKKGEQMLCETDDTRFDTLMDIIACRVALARCKARGDEAPYDVESALSSAYIREIKRLRVAHGYGLVEIVSIANALALGMQRAK
jgi:hypothetical protein